MRSRLFTLGLVLGSLALCGESTRALVAPAGSSGYPPGQKLSAGLLGGFRSLVADFLWLRVEACWEERRLEATLENLRLVAMMDPRPLVFWLNGARMMAYDMPSWRIATQGGHDAAGGVWARIEDEQVRLALAWLDAAEQFHPGSAAIFIERANICLNVRHDVAGAAANYRRAAEQPDAPYYAARLHGEMLRRLGRKAEAHAWLTQIHGKLPVANEAAAAGLVLARIRELEDDLALPLEQRYQTP